MTTTTVKTLETMAQAKAYAATCARRDKDPRTHYTPIPRPDGRWDIQKRASR